MLLRKFSTLLRSVSAQIDSLAAFSLLKPPADMNQGHINLVCLSQSKQFHRSENLLGITLAKLFFYLHRHHRIQIGLFGISSKPHSKNMCRWRDVLTGWKSSGVWESWPHASSPITSHLFLHHVMPVKLELWADAAWPHAVWPVVLPDGAPPPQITPEAWWCLSYFRASISKLQGHLQKFIVSVVHLQSAQSLVLI